MAKHIGIVGCSAPGAALCYETICMEGPALLGRKYAHPEVSMHTYSFAQYFRRMKAGDWQGVGEMMLASAEKLKKMGAELVVSPVNLMHQGLDLVIERAPLPWLHIAEEVAQEAKRRGYKRVALLGTKPLMEGPVYPPKMAAAGLEYAIPKAEDLRKQIA